MIQISIGIGWLWFFFFGPYSDKMDPIRNRESINFTVSISGFGFENWDLRFIWNLGFGAWDLYDAILGIESLNNSIRVLKNTSIDHPAWNRYGCNQLLGVRILGIVDDISGLTVFDDFTAVHHRDPIGDMADHT
jgi:hypothetical protein